MSHVIHAGLSDRGRVRGQNEDRWFADPQQGLYLVADGMGGGPEGELAARIVVETLPPLLRERMKDMEGLSSPRAAEQVAGALSDLSNRLRNESRGQLGLEGMGAAVVLALVQPEAALIAHMGDSRAYLLRQEHLNRLTKDHSIIQLLLDAGEITMGQVADHPARGQLMRYIGMPADPLPEVRFFELCPNDWLLLCSDGLTNMVSDAEILSILPRIRTPSTACKRLISAANASGGRDNITAIIIEVLEA